jgi:transposase
VALYSLIVTAKLNDIDPEAWLADVLARTAHGATRSGGLITAPISADPPG